jgi:hypothetical protein
LVEPESVSSNVDDGHSQKKAYKSVNNEVKIGNHSRRLSALVRNFAQEEKFKPGVEARSMLMMMM